MKESLKQKRSEKYLAFLKKSMPDGIELKWDSIQYDVDINDDEFLAMLTIIKAFRMHHEEHGMEIRFPIVFPIISKRIRLDFGLYRKKEGKYNHEVYICVNQRKSIKYLISTWRLSTERYK